MIRMKQPQNTCKGFWHGCSCQGCLNREKKINELAYKVKLTQVRGQETEARIQKPK